MYLFCITTTSFSVSNALEFSTLNVLVSMLFMLPVYWCNNRDLKTFLNLDLLTKVKYDTVICSV